MKNKLSFIAAAFFTLFLSGCLPSIHPLYTSKDLTFDPLLEGSWVDKDNQNQWIFKGLADSSYRLIYQEQGFFGNDTATTISEFEVHLVNLKGHHFLDFYPGDNDHYRMSSLLATSLLPVHLFARIEYIESEYQVSFLNSDWFKNSIEAKKIDIAHEKTKESIVLTASTQDLQKMILQNVDNPDAFSNPAILVKSGK